MPDEEREKHGGENRTRETKGIEVRPRNWLVPVILSSLRQWSSYGYKLMEHAATFGFETMNPGTLYRNLRNIEKDGVVESNWDTTTNREGPARRVYSITDVGEAYLNFWAKSLVQYQRNLDAFFSLYTGGRPPARGDRQKDEG